MHAAVPIHLASANETFGIHGRIVPQARSGHVIVQKGHYVVVLGGFTTDTFGNSTRLHSMKEVWIYHTSFGRWQLKVTKGQVPQGTCGGGAICIGEYIYLFGGHTGNVQNGNHSNDINRLHIQTLKWERITTNGSTPSPRAKFTCWEHRDKLYVFGGYGGTFDGHLRDVGDFYPNFDAMLPMKGWNNQLLVFDPAECLWTAPASKGSQPSPRAAHASAKVGSKVYIFGGRCGNVRLDDLHILELETLTWSGKLLLNSPCPSERSWHTLTSISANTLLLYGGINQYDQVLGDSWLLNIDLLEWTQLELSSPKARMWHTAARADAGEVIIFGGCTNSSTASTQDTVVHCNDTITILCSPKALLRLCVETNLQYKSRLRSGWQELPRYLCNLLTSFDQLDPRTIMTARGTSTISTSASSCNVS